MRYLKKIGLAGMLGVAATFAPVSGVATAQAAPGVMAQIGGMQDLQRNAAMLQEVQNRRGRGWGKRGRGWNKGNRGYRGGKRYNRRYRRDRGFNPGVAIGLGILGAMIARGHSESYARSAMQRCDDRFRSFEWSTGYYTTYGGQKRLCPYLR
ncbi:MAG: BA14K family protein [Rhodomicrobiaceae bacterium]